MVLVSSRTLTPLLVMRSFSQLLLESSKARSSCSSSSRSLTSTSQLSPSNSPSLLPGTKAEAAVVLMGSSATALAATDEVSTSSSTERIILNFSPAFFRYSANASEFTIPRSRQWSCSTSTTSRTHAFGFSILCIPSLPK